MAKKITDGIQRKAKPRFMYVTATTGYVLMISQWWVVCQGNLVVNEIASPGALTCRTYKPDVLVNFFNK